jgi:hypothetical protein
LTHLYGSFLRKASSAKFLMNRSRQWIFGDPHCNILYFSVMLFIELDLFSRWLNFRFLFFFGNCVMETPGTFYWCDNKIEMYWIFRFWPPTIDLSANLQIEYKYIFKPLLFLEN